MANTFNFRAFRKTLLYQSQAPIAEVQADLRSLGRFHERLVRQYNYATVALILCISLPVALLFALSYLGDLGWVLILGSVLAAIAAGTLRNRARLGQFSRHRDRLLDQVLGLLQRDMAPEAPLAVELSAGYAQQAGPPVSSQPHPILPGWQLEHYRDLWFSLQGEFLDQTRFSLKLLEKTDVPRHEQDWGKALGQGFDLILQCQTLPEIYGDLSILREQWAGAVKLPPGARLVHCEGTEREVLLIAALPPAFTASLVYQAIVMLLLSAYQGLNLARHLAQAVPNDRAVPSDQAVPNDQATPNEVFGVAAMPHDIARGHGIRGTAQLSGARSGSPPARNRLDGGQPSKQGAE